MKDVLTSCRNHKISEADCQAALNYIRRLLASPAAKCHINPTSTSGARRNQQIMRLNIERDKLTWTQVYQGDNWYSQYYRKPKSNLRLSGYKGFTTIDLKSEALAGVR